VTTWALIAARPAPSSCESRSRGGGCGHPPRGVESTDITSIGSQVGLFLRVWRARCASIRSCVVGLFLRFSSSVGASWAPAMVAAIGTVGWRAIGKLLDFPRFNGFVFAFS
jgi:hypothetical protein